LLIDSDHDRRRFTAKRYLRERIQVAIAEPEHALANQTVHRRHRELMAPPVQHHNITACLYTRAIYTKPLIASSLNLTELHESFTALY
jgi:hypothetical protein